MSPDKTRERLAARDSISNTHFAGSIHPFGSSVWASPNRPKPNHRAGFAAPS